MSPSFSGLSFGNAVADDVVDRGAGRLVIAAVHQRRGQRAVVHREFEHEAVDLLGGHARLHLVGQHVEAFGGELAGLAHARECLRAVELDLPGLAQRREGRIDVVHGEKVRFTGNLVIEAGKQASRFLLLPMRERVAAQRRGEGLFGPAPYPTRVRSAPSPTSRGEGEGKNYAAILPPSSSSICTRMISSNAVFDLEAERQRALGVEPRRPAGDDLHDQAVRLAADARRDLVAGDPAQRRDLLADRAGDARHGEIDARAELARASGPRHESGSRPPSAGWRASASRFRRPAAPPPCRRAARG